MWAQIRAELYSEKIKQLQHHKAYPERLMLRAIACPERLMLRATGCHLHPMAMATEQ